ncbi:MAG TPA: plastocyanin/azurin family copper-binding protein [Oligoflexus sp.]|uniref:cupredoxin domain-containing protein n=1 Tax=Oligoflexus sp. TaxID=1971216 RepID=UPI002D417183|nr:plastocyanin/azurin family copper-binding protein [Oligoflexus sp.]HYX32276.1 plastocyanin/azurin family copper-binding protein [Oligoflexus sp.]
MYRSIFLGLILVHPATLALAEVHKVYQKGKSFSTQELKIKAGDSVVFHNDDDTAHNVFSSSAGTRFNLKIQNPGTKNEQKFEKPGEGDIRCAIHPSMKIKLKIEE